MADPSDAKDYARSRAELTGIDWPTYEKQIQLESGWQHWSAPGIVKSSPTGSMGLGQLNSKFYPEVYWRDPYTNLTKSIEIMADYLKRFGNYRYALAAYNWGPSNVSGYKKPDGTVVPPWDGSRETISNQGAHYLDVILGPDWAEPGSTPVQPSGVIYEDRPDPEPAGVFVTTPRGIILHGSRSGRAGNPKDVEYRGTANWEVNNPDSLGWNATIGEDRVAVHLPPTKWGWNALQASKVYLGVELAQATVDEPITDAQVRALADWIKTRVLPVWPKLPMHFPSHTEVDKEFGVNQGKTDVFPDKVRMDSLRTRLMTALKGDVDPVPEYSVGQGILDSMVENGDQPASNEVYTKGANGDEWSEAFGRSGARYIWLPSISRIFRYEPTK